MYLEVIPYWVMKGAKFDQMPDLNEHIASVHEGKKPFKCDKCESCFNLKKDLNVHVASVHEGNKPFQCKMCDVQF